MATGTTPATETTESFDEFTYMGRMTAIGKGFGLSGEKLAKWVTEQVDKHKEELREQAIREHELELARVRAQTPDSDASSASGAQPRERAPPMQKYEEDGKQPLDTYIRTFESLATANDGTEAEKIRWLLASMPPRLTALVNDLTVDQLRDYEVVKSTLLASQNFSPAECRARFVSAFPLKEENCSTFGSRKESPF